MSDTLDSILREHLVRCGNPVSRAELVARLESEGMTPEDLRLICETHASRGLLEAETAAHIGQTIRTRSSWEAFVDDATYAKAHRAASPQSHGRRRERPATNQPELGAAEAMRARDEEYILQRVTIDGKAPEFVAEQMNMSVADVNRILDEAPR